MLTLISLLMSNPQQGGGSFQLIFILLFILVQYLILKYAIKDGIIAAKNYENKQKNKEQ
jgi:hypothetical protein